MRGIELRNIYKDDISGHHSVNDVSLDTKDGEFVVLVGPSGCGKSTTLRIVQFTDTHIGNRPYIIENLEILSLVKDVDLIFEELMGYFNTGDIPVALTYGNHDSEEIITRNDLRRLFEKNVSKRADKNHVFIHGDRERYTLEILANDTDEVAQVLYVLDSGEEAPLPIGIYDWNQPEQVEWFRKTSAKYRKGDGIKRNLVFQHIPVPEYWQAATNILAGVNNETWGMFVAHDHENNFDGLHHGIHLVYGNVSGFNAYGEMERGVRVIELNAKTNTITTEVVKYHAFKK